MVRLTYTVISSASHWVCVPVASPESSILQGRRSRQFASSLSSVGSAFLAHLRNDPNLQFSKSAPLTKLEVAHPVPVCLASLPYLLNLQFCQGATLVHLGAVCPVPVSLVLLSHILNLNSAGCAALPNSGAAREFCKAIQGHVLHIGSHDQASQK